MFQNYWCCIYDEVSPIVFLRALCVYATTSDVLVFTIYHVCPRRAIKTQQKTSNTKKVKMFSLYINTKTNNGYSFYLWYIELNINAFRYMRTYILGGIIMIFFTSSVTIIPPLFATFFLHKVNIFTRYDKCCVWLTLIVKKDTKEIGCEDVQTCGTGRWSLQS